MADQPVEYTKLTRRRKTFGGSSQVWLSRDEQHLLLVRTVWFVQHYQRFRLREIRALVVEGREQYLFSLIALAVVAALLIAASIAGSVTTAGKVLGSVVFGSALAVLVLNIYRGRFGGVTIVTAVSSTPVPAISRLDAANDFVMRVTPLIQAAQADLAPAPQGEERHVAPPMDRVPPLPEKTPPLMLSAVFHALMIVIGVLTEVGLYRELSGLEAFLAVVLILAQLVLSPYLAFKDKRSLTGQVMAGLAGAFQFGTTAAGISATIWKSSSPLYTGLPEHLRTQPAWSVQLDRVAAPLAIAIGVLGLGFTIYRMRSPGAKN